jgi:YegS/Rv2252/BmrU family lipid kinase
MSVRNLFVILNPAADRGRTAALAPMVRRELRRGRRPFEIALTAGPGHAAQLAEGAARAGWEAVVAVGGDGLVHEVVNGLMRAARDGCRAALGVVPAGSGNDFAKLLSVPGHHPDLAIQRVLAAEPRGVDVGRVNRCVAQRTPPVPWYFTNGVGLGFDAQVAVEAAKIRRLKGFAIYAAAVARTLRRLRSPRMRVELDGREIADRPLVLATLGNGACHGGSFWLCPGARLDDGLLDVLTADGRSVWEVMALLPKVLGGRHLGERGVAVERGRVARVSSDEPLPLHADGERVAAGVTDIEVEVLPGALPVLG